MSVTVSKFSYSERNKTPTGYICEKCGASGVRLYREYQTLLDHQHLYCRACAIVKSEKNEPLEYPEFSEHSIGWLVAAVPTEDGETYWGFTSAPDAGVKWWEALPKA